VLAARAVSGQEIPQRDVHINFEGNKAVPGERLLEVADECLGKFPRQRRRLPDEIDYCLKQVQFFLACQGYLRAKVGQPRARAETADGVKVTVPVEEGARYRLGKVTIEGARLFPPGYILAMLDLKTGDVAGSGAILEWLDKRVERAYAEVGHIQYAADPEPYYYPVSPETGEGVVDFKVDISEGRRFVVRRIEFVGNRRTPEQTLRDAMLLKGGEPFNRALHEEGVRNLNRLGLFEEIDPDSDVEYKGVNRKPPERGGLLDLIFHLKEKARP
jgi:outer membrane protein insertion porin family